MTDVLIRSGQEDRGAFRELYALTSAKLFGVCLRICGERQGAEDVLSDVFLTIWKRAGAYEPGRGSPITWLCTIARNRAVDWRRSRAARPAGHSSDIPEIADGAAGALQGMLVAEESRRLHLCLDALDERTRMSVRTAFFDGLTYAELAEREDVPLGTMKSRLRRGLLRLKDCLDGDV